jgi:hypothetical protein
MDAPIYSMQRVKCLWKWFVVTYIHHLEWVRVIQASKIFRLDKKQEYLKFHNRWRQLNKDEAQHTYIRGHHMPGKHRTHKYEYVEDVRWLDAEGEQICYKCKCLSKLCLHSPKYLKKVDRAIIGWTHNIKNRNDDDDYWNLFGDTFTTVKDNLFHPCVICQNHKYVLNQDCPCKLKTFFYGYKCNKESGSYSSIKHKNTKNANNVKEKKKDKQHIWIKGLSENAINRIAVRNQRLESINEKNATSHWGSNCAANSYSNIPLFKGRGWPLFKAKYDELQRVLHSPCDICWVYDAGNMHLHVCSKETFAKERPETKNLL